MQSDHQHAVVRASRLLRGHTSGTLLVDSTPYEEMLYIIDPRSGSLVLSVDHELLDGTDTVLVIPQDTFEAPLRVSLELLQQIDEEPCDRFMAYHTRQPGAVYVHGKINFAKIDSGEVISQGELETPNPLINELSGLCKKLNSDRKALREVCKLLTRIDIEDPIAVGVDHLGFDVRARFGVVRVELPSRVETGTQAEDVIAALIGGVL